MGSKSATGAETAPAADTTTAAAEAAAADLADDIAKVAQSSPPYAAAAKATGSEIGIRLPRPVALVLLQDLPQHPAVQQPRQELAE